MGDWGLQNSCNINDPLQIENGCSRNNEMSHFLYFDIIRKVICISTTWKWICLSKFRTIFAYVCSNGWTFHNDKILHFRLDCGTGPGIVRTSGKVRLNHWNRLTVFRHDWGVWLQLNGGRHDEGRSQVIWNLFYVIHSPYHV